MHSCVYVNMYLCICVYSLVYLFSPRCLHTYHRKDIRDEKDDTTQTRMLEFLLVLNYKNDLMDQDLNAFREAFIGGDKNIVYPLLYWMLNRIPQLKKRAYLVRGWLELVCVLMSVVYVCVCACARGIRDFC